MKKHLYEAIRKYGEANFKMDVIECCNDNAANDRERYWIAYYQSCDRDKGYNKTMGGEGGNTWKLNTHKAETSAKLSEKLKGHSVNWDAIRRNAELRRGTTLSKEQREKISQTMKAKCLLGEIVPPPIQHYDRTGEHHTPEARKKMSHARVGKSYEEIFGDKAEEIKEKARQRWVGEKNPRYKNVSTEQIVDLIKRGFSNQDVALQLHIQPQTVWARLKSIGKTATELRKEFVNENNV